MLEKRQKGGKNNQRLESFPLGKHKSEVFILCASHMLQQ